MLHVLERAPLELDRLFRKLSIAICEWPRSTLRKNRLHVCRKKDVAAVIIGALFVCVTLVVHVMVRDLATFALIQRVFVCLWNLRATLPEFGAVGETIMSFGLVVKCGLSVVTVTPLQRPCGLLGPLTVVLGPR